MAGSPPKLPPPTFTAGSSSSPKPPPPPTFPVHPSYEELIDNYLRNRVVDGTQADFIHEADLYGADPNLLTSNLALVTAINGETAWYFFTLLLPKAKGSVDVESPRLMKRNMDTGREGSWVASGGATNHDLSKGQRRIGRRQGYHFEEVDGKGVKTTWRMIEFRLDPNEGGQEPASPDLLVLSKVYRSGRNAKAEEGGSSMAVAKADAEAPAAPAAVTPGRDGADEDVGAETTAGPGRKRKAGDKDSGADMVVPSPGLQKKADGESAGAATAGEIFAAEKAEQEEPRVPGDSGFCNFFGGDSSAPLDATEEEEQEPRDRKDPPFYNFFKDPLDAPGEAEQKPRDRQNKDDGESADVATTGEIFADSNHPLHPAEKAEQEEPRNSRFHNFFDDSSAPLDDPEEAEQKPRDPRNRPFYDFFKDSQNPKKQ